MAIQRKTSNKKMHYFIANNHTGTIIFPRSGQGAIRLPPLVLLPGKSVLMQKDDWERLKANQGVQNYLDAGLISEVDREGTVPVSSQTTTILPIPDHLMRDEEMGQQTDVKSQVVRRKASTLTID
jgi:hypothetical protein